MKVIALVDGEHYPPVTRWGIEQARARGMDVVAALLAGGVEKLSGGTERPDLGVRVLAPAPGEDAAARLREALASAIEELRPDAVLDLSDEPVLGYRVRMELAGVALAGGVAYLGADFRFDPPVTEPPLPAATIAVIGAGKRVAKTALSAHLARVAVGTGRRPVIVAMGRGGPAAPTVARPEDVTVAGLLARADRGEHAASDYLEDASVAGVPAVGARRVGGGLAGRPFATNVAEAAAIAVELGGDPVILEGSGAAVPTVPWDAGVLVVPGTLAPEHLAGYLGPYRVLLSDLLVLIIGASSSAEQAEQDNLSTLESSARRLRAQIRVARAELHPVPLADVRGKDAFFATTARDPLATRLARRLERDAGCRIVTTSSALSDRSRLDAELRAAPPFDVLLTELKGAAIDVAARRATERGAEVVIVDNRPSPAGGDGDVDELLREILDLADERARARGSETEGA